MEEKEEDAAFEEDMIQTQTQSPTHRHNKDEDFTAWLPDECLACVFQKMGTMDHNQCSLVCKRWYHVEAHCRQRLSLYARAEIISFLPSIFMRFDRITKLALRCDRKTTSMDDKALFLVGRHCSTLRKLKIKGCRQLTDEGIELFARVASSTLCKLSCGACSFGARGINAVVNYCTLLEDLTVKRLKGLEEGPPEFIGPGCGTIRRLCLKELYNAQLFGPLMAGSKNLHTIIIYRSSGNWDSLLTIVSEQISNLVELHMEMLHLSDRGLQAVSRWTKLEVLYVVKTTECSDFGLSAIAEGCRRLKKLHINGLKSNRIGDDGITALASKCRDLQEVILIGVNATAASLGLMASNCSGLERLALCNSATVGDTELSCITSKCNSLKRLCLKGCSISDEGMRGLATGCPRLIKVKIKKCKGVTWESVYWLQVHRPGLVVSLDCEAPNTRLLEGITEVSPVLVPPSPRSRSPLAKVKFALVASGSFVACSLLRWPLMKGKR
ncbi:hypothetical protein KP509_07G027600 [Ceratopteris richardii]|nr:hypothetical protein KP509_07G027600 [Ceratopteris richardii]